MYSFPHRVMCFATALVICALMAGCKSTPRTTRMTVDDMEAMAQAMARSLVHSDALAARGPDRPAWTVSIDKVKNLSSDVMTTDEQWAVMAQLRGALPIAQLWDLKNVRFVLPPERVVAQREGDTSESLGSGFGARRQPTHTMAATFRSVTRAVAERRTDLYYCEFEILDLETGESIWHDRFEYKREAHGHVWD